VRYNSFEIIKCPEVIEAGQQVAVDLITALYSVSGIREDSHSEPQAILEISLWLYFREMGKLK